MDVWAVSWRYLGERHVMDFDREEEATRFGMEVAELSGRKEVLVTKHELDIDPALKERIWKRFQQRLAVTEIPPVMKEASG